MATQVSLTTKGTQILEMTSLFYVLNPLISCSSREILVSEFQLDQCGAREWSTNLNHRVILQMSVTSNTGWLLQIYVCSAEVGEVCQTNGVEKKSFAFALLQELLWFMAERWMSPSFSRTVHTSYLSLTRKHVNALQWLACPFYST